MCDYKWVCCCSPSESVCPAAGFHLHPPPRCRCRRQPAAWLQMQDGPARIGLCRLGSARPTDTMTYIRRPEAAAAAALTSLTAVSTNSISTTSGSISFTHWSDGFSYLSVKSAAFYTVPIFPPVLLLCPLSLLSLCSSSSRPPPPDLSAETESVFH